MYHVEYSLLAVHSVVLVHTFHAVEYATTLLASMQAHAERPYTNSIQGHSTPEYQQVWCTM